jgi:hypothetical protein
MLREINNVTLNNGHRSSCLMQQCGTHQIDFDLCASALKTAPPIPDTFLREWRLSPLCHPRIIEAAPGYAIVHSTHLM